MPGAHFFPRLNGTLEKHFYYCYYCHGAQGSGGQLNFSKGARKIFSTLL